jgi:hypothetical protein
LIETFDYRDDCDHSSDADDNAYQRQCCSQFVSAKTGSGDAKRFPDRR